MIGSPLLGRLTGPAEIVGRNEKKGCAAGEAVHSNEWKYMVVMCCNEWCSFQGPGPPPRRGYYVTSVPVGAFGALSALFYPRWPFGWWMIGSPLLGRLTGPAEIVGRNEKKGCAAGEAVHSNEWKYIYMYCIKEKY